MLRHLGYASNKTILSQKTKNKKTKLYVEKLYNYVWTLMAQSCCEAVLQEPKNVMGLLTQDFATCQSESCVVCVRSFFYRLISLP